MVVIRMARGGAKNRPFYNNRRSQIPACPADGRFIERIGFDNPKAAEAEPKYRLALDRVVVLGGQGRQAALDDAAKKLIKRGKAHAGRPEGAPAK